MVKNALKTKMSFSHKNQPKGLLLCQLRDIGSFSNNKKERKLRDMVILLCQPKGLLL